MIQRLYRSTEGQSECKAIQAAAQAESCERGWYTRKKSRVYFLLAWIER